MTSKRDLAAVLNQIILLKTVDFSEYQDKYYFVKQVKVVLPFLHEDSIYKALEDFKNSSSFPVKKRRFISKFADNLLYHG